MVLRRTAGDESRLRGRASARALLPERFVPRTCRWRRARDEHEQDGERDVPEFVDRHTWVCRISTFRAYTAPAPADLLRSRASDFATDRSVDGYEALFERLLRG